MQNELFDHKYPLWQLPTYENWNVLSSDILFMNWKYGKYDGGKYEYGKYEHGQHSLQSLSSASESC